MKSDISETFALVGAAIVSLATIAVLVSRGATTQNVIANLGAGFSQLLNVSLSPITGRLSPVNGISGISTIVGTGTGTGGTGSTGSVSLGTNGNVTGAGTSSGSGGVGIGDTEIHVGGARVVADPNTSTYNGKTYHWTGGDNGEWIEVK